MATIMEMPSPKINVLSREIPSGDSVTITMEVRHLKASYGSATVLRDVTLNLFSQVVTASLLLVGGRSGPVIASLPPLCREGRARVRQAHSAVANGGWPRTV